MREEWADAQDNRYGIGHRSCRGNGGGGGHDTNNVRAVDRDVETEPYTAISADIEAASSCGVLPDSSDSDSESDSDAARAGTAYAAAPTRSTAAATPTAGHETHARRSRDDDCASRRERRDVHRVGFVASRLDRLDAVRCISYLDAFALRDDCLRVDASAPKAGAAQAPHLFTAASRVAYGRQQHGAERGAVTTRAGRPVWRGRVLALVGSASSHYDEHVAAVASMCTSGGYDNDKGDGGRCIGRDDTPHDALRARGAASAHLPSSSCRLSHAQVSLVTVHGAGFLVAAYRAHTVIHSIELFLRGHGLLLVGDW